MIARTPVLSGKTALVTGASRGIGRAIAQRLAAAGAMVVVTARSLDRSIVLPGTLMETVALIERAGGKAIPLAADLEAPSDRDGLVARAVEIAGSLQILVNGAGLCHLSSVESMPLEIFDLTVDHYLRAPFVLSRAAIPIMRACGGGWIVNIGSGADRMLVRPFSEIDRTIGATVLGAVKLALRRFTVGLAAELEADNIAVNMAIPSGSVKTPGADRLNLASRLNLSEHVYEPVEYMAETVLALCNESALERTGDIAYSSRFLVQNNIPVYSLDGRTALPAVRLSV